jgi:4-amino-4-deoxy-L-arabinose transferase-like glycosyltransferase
MQKKTLIRFSVLLVFLFLVVAVSCAFLIKLPFDSTQQLFFNRSVVEIYGQKEVGQTFESTKNNLSAVSFKIATFGTRENNKDVIFELRRKIDDNDVLRTVVVNARNFTDHRFYQFNFSPVVDSKGKNFYASLRSPESFEGNAVTIDYKNNDVYGGNDLAMVVWDRGGVGGVESTAIKKNNDTAFTATYIIPAGEYLKLNTIRYVNNFIYSVRNETGEYYKMGKFVGFAVLLTYILLLINGKLEKKRNFIIFFVILILAGVGLRLIYVNQMPYTNDEGFYLYDARTVLEGHFPGGDAIAKAPLFIGATAVSVAILGHILTASRLVSLFCGIIAAWPIYYIGKMLKNKTLGMAAVAIWLLSGATALFNSYGHTETIQNLFVVGALAALLFALEKKKWHWFLFAGVLLGLSIVARKSSLALGVPVLFLIFLGDVSWRKKVENIFIGGVGMISVIFVFLAGIYLLYGLPGVSYASGVSLAKTSISQLSDRGDLYATYSINGILPLFREAMPILFLLFIMIGQLAEKLLSRVNWLASRLGWIIPLVFAVACKNFIWSYETKLHLTPGVGLFWSLMPFLIILFAIFPLKRINKESETTVKMLLLPVVWFVTSVVFYAFWIKFSANYLAEFLPPLVLAAALGAVWLKNNFSGKKYWLVFVFIVLSWANYSSAMNAFKFDHTGTFHWSAILEAADYLKKNVPQNELVETAAVAIPYVSGHHVPYDAAHPTWYAYGFIEPELRNVFMAPSEKMQETMLKDVKWFVGEKLTAFSYFLEYPKIEEDVNNNFTKVFEIENFSNPISIYKRK